MKHEELTHKIIGCAYQVFNKLGFGFLESVYKKAILIELESSELKAEQEKPLKVYYNGPVVGDFYVDIFVEDEIIALPPRLSSRPARLASESVAGRWRAGRTEVSRKPLKS